MFEKVLYCFITFMLTMLLCASLAEKEFDKKDAQLEEAFNACPESMVCYEPYGATPQAEYVMAGAMVKVDFVDASAMPAGTEAYATWIPDFEENYSICIITVQFPSHVLGDPIMDSLGHELLHCITGKFHP